MLLLETGMLALLIVIALLKPKLASRQLEALKSRFSLFARRRALSVVVIAALALFLRIAVLPVEPIPEPIVHDEFGYLLAADTFAHGRLTNPTPPMWEHFETFSILMKPTYQCFAQPAQGMMLAFGKVLFGNPFWGVWLSCGLMCAAITWMLQGWLSPGWALLGGLLSVLRYGVFSYWADSYWGGAMGAIGGALVLGALPRIKESQRVRDALLMALGLAILANNRPFEGFLFSIPIAIVLVAWIFSSKSPRFGVTLPRVIAPLALALVLIAAATGYYFFRVTGSPFRMPYQVERETYGVAPYMLWQPVRPEPQYHHAVMRKMYVDEEFAGYKFFRSVPGVLLKLYLCWSFFLGPALTFPFLMLAFTLPRDFSWKDISPAGFVLSAIFLVSAFGWTVETFYNPHYSAPATCVIVAFVLLSMRVLQRWGDRGRLLSAGLIFICVISFLVRAFATPLHVSQRDFFAFSWYQKPAASFGRAAVDSQLQEIAGKHIVVVRYRAYHEPFEEWVYNRADVVSSKIIWARDMGPSENQRLVDYFKERKVWILDADEKPPKLQPWSLTSSEPQATAPNGDNAH